MPVELQGFVVQFEQPFLAQPRLVAYYLGFFRCRTQVFVLALRFGLLVIEITQARLNGVVEVIGDGLLLAGRGGSDEFNGRFGLRCGDRFRVLFSRLQFEAVALALHRLVTQQGFGPGFVMHVVGLVRRAAAEILGVARRLFQREELLRQLLFLLLQSGQFLIEVEAVQVEIVMNPQGIVGGLGRWRPGVCVGLGCGRSAHRFSCRWRRCDGTRAEQLFGSIEHVQAGTAAYCAMGSSQLRLADAEAGTAIGALGDVAFAHARVRKIQAASLTQRLRAVQRLTPLMRTQPSLTAVGSRSKALA